MSVVSPEQHSISEGNLFSSVTSSESRGTFTLHSPLHVSLEDSAFLSDSASGDFLSLHSISSEGSLFPHHLAFGDPVSSLKDDHIFRVGFCNVGGFPAMFGPNPKAQEIKHFMALHDIDLFGGCEANLNWSRAPDSMRLLEWFRDIPSCRTYSAHNVTEKMGLKQYGGTFWIGTSLASQFIVDMDKDPTGLGRWVSCTLSGRSNRKIHLVFGYRPCLNSWSRLRSVYAQHHWYFSSIHRTVCPRSAFFLDLAACIQVWRAHGDEVLLFADLNGDVRHPEVSQFASSCGLQKCILSRYPSLPPPVTFHRGDHFGSSPIDGAWCTDGLFLSATTIYPVDQGPGDHRAFVVDLHLRNTIGEPRLRVVCPPARRLSCAIPGAVSRYTEAFSHFSERVHLPQRLNSLFMLAQQPNLDRAFFLSEMEKFDRLKADGMRFAEKRCRRLHMGAIQFSPDLNIWRNKKELWRLVLRRHLGYRVHAVTIRRLACKLHILDPLSVPLLSVRRYFQEAKQRYEALKPHHEILQHSFLLERLQDPTLSDEQHTAISKLVALERVRDSFRRIRMLRGLKLGSSISQVEIQGPSGPQVVSDRHSVEHALCQSLQNRFTKAHGSPFLHGQLALDVDPYGCGPAARSILEGTYTCPPGTDDYTKQFIEALKWPILRPELVSMILNTDAFCAHWKQARERTSSSFSGLHFGHYKAAAFAPPLAHLHARFTQLVFMTGISLSRYQSGLQVILEKSLGLLLLIFYVPFY